MCLQMSLCSFNIEVNNLYKKINALQTLDMQNWLNEHIDSKNKDDQFLINAVNKIGYLEVLDAPGHNAEQTLSKIEIYSKDTPLSDLDKYYEKSGIYKQKLINIMNWKIESCHKLRNIKDHDGTKNFDTSCRDYDINPKAKQRLLNRIEFLTH